MNIKNIDKTLEKLISLGWFLSGDGSYSRLPVTNGGKPEQLRTQDVPNWRASLISDKELSKQKELNKISDWISDPDWIVHENILNNSMKGKVTERYHAIKFILQDLKNAIDLPDTVKKLEILIAYQELAEHKFAEEVARFNAMSENKKCELVSIDEMILFDLDNPSDNVMKTAFLSSNPKGSIPYEEDRYFYQVYEKLATSIGKKVGATSEEREAIKPENRLTPEENIAIMRQMPVLAYLILKDKVTEEEVNVALEVFPELLFVNRIFGENIEYLYYNPLALEIIETQGENKLSSGVCEEILKKNLALTKKRPKLKELAPIISEKSSDLYIKLLTERNYADSEAAKRVEDRVRKRFQQFKKQFSHEQKEGYNG